MREHVFEFAITVAYAVCEGLLSGTGSPVLVGGPTGVGKTAFVRRAATHSAWLCN